VLDRSLVDPAITIGNWMLIFNQHYSQHLTIKNGEASILFTPGKQTLEVAIPVTETDKAPQKPRSVGFFNRLIGIDLGERRVGFAVFDLDRYIKDGHADPVVGADGVQLSGTVAIPSIRGLIDEVHRFRRRDQPGQKLTDRYNRRLEQYRENVVADVCRVIDALCAEYGAFPVLESSVRNFESGARQLDLVYKSVLNRYSYSKVDAHQMARAQHWFGSQVWTHPTALVREWDEESQKYSNRLKPLKLFPGALIAPAGTSQTCCKCRRNPFSALRELEDKKQVPVEQGGIVRTGIGNLRILAGYYYPEEEYNRARRNLRRLGPNKPVNAGLYARLDLEKYLKQSLRQAPGSTRTKDSSQSVYHCAFVDCSSIHHADEGAGVNIGRKFLNEKIGR
jgi:hypothetical protein